MEISSVFVGSFFTLADLVLNVTACNETKTAGRVIFYHIPNVFLAVQNLSL